jgi:hypothetical protein
VLNRVEHRTLGKKETSRGTIREKDQGGGKDREVGVVMIKVHCIYE